MDETSFRDAIAEIDGVLTARQRALPAPVRTLHRWILRQFADVGTAPSPDTLSEWAAELGVDAPDALALLVAVDLIEADPASARIHGAYPFVAEARGHQVRLEDGRIVHAYCAVDALGIPIMLGRDAAITSTDPHTGEQIRIEVHGGQATSQPAQAAISVPAMDSVTDADQQGQAADVSCPTVNFYATAESGHAYAKAHELDLEILTLPQAMRTSTVVFGDLLKP